MSKKPNQSNKITTTSVVKKVDPVVSKLEERREEIKQIFALFDKDGDNKISAEEVKSLLFSIGRVVNDSEVKKLLQEVDKDNSGAIELEEFINYIESTFVLPQSSIDEVVEAFKIFDIDGNGWISALEFRNILTKFGGEFTNEEVDKIFIETDLDHDGKLTYAEFIELWKFQ